MAVKATIQTDPLAPPRPGPRRGGQRAARILAPLALLLVVLATWEGLKALYAIPDYKLPHLAAIGQAFFNEYPPSPTRLCPWEFSEPRPARVPIWQALSCDALLTWGEAVAGFALGGAFGFALGAVLAHSPLLARGLLPFVVASQTVPLLAVAPVIVIGLGLWGAPEWLPRAFIAAYLTFFPVTVNTLRGLLAVEPDALQLLHSYAASPLQIFFKLRLPAALPYLFVALRLSATASVVGALIGELPSSPVRGLGAALLNAVQYNTIQPANLWMTIAVTALVGLGFYALVGLAERLILRERTLAE